MFERYEVERRDGDVFVYAPFRPPSSRAWPIHIHDGRSEEDRGLRRYYAPLRDYPDLFLRFVALTPRQRLPEDEALRKMLDWVKDYGVLGLADVDYLEGPSGHWEHRRGRRESLPRFWQEVTKAAEVFELFEAASVPGGPSKEITRALTRWHYPTKGMSLRKQREFALERAADVVGKRVRTECFPKLYQEISSKRSETVGFAQGRGFHSLLGAMYLEMMSLMTEAMSDTGNVRRCRRPGCANIITFVVPLDPSSPRSGSRGKYRTRKDKIYCSKACSQWVRDQAKKAQPN